MKYIGAETNALIAAAVRSFCEQKVTAQVFEAIASVNEVDGVTILLVEQNAFMALNVAHRGYLLENGVIRHSGTSKELMDSPAVRDAYLGA